MADYRSVKVQMWRSDEWFQELPTDARLFWIYLFTNPSARVAGIYKLTTRTMCFECGLSASRVEELKAQFSQAGKAHFENDVVWVVRMRELQSPGKISDNLQKGIDNDVAEIPDCALKTRYMIGYGYPMHTLSASPDTVLIPFPTTQHNTKERRGEEGNTPSPAHDEPQSGSRAALDLPPPAPPIDRAVKSSAGTWEAFMQARGGAVNGMDSEQLGELETLYGEAATKRAIEWANMHKNQSLLSIAYVAKILAGWQMDGTLDAGPSVNGNGSKPKKTYHEELRDGQTVMVED